METQNLDPKEDSILAKYLYEMNNDGNDGWSKQHYSDLYDKRVSELELIKKALDEYHARSSQNSQPLGDDLGL